MTPFACKPKAGDKPPPYARRARDKPPPYARAAAAGAIAIAIAHCVGDPPAPEPLPEPPPPIDAVAQLYPTLSELYAAGEGVYASCGPNANVCHNARQYPNLATLESIALSASKPCNQLRDKPAEIHDLCERRGDVLQIGVQRLEIGFFAPLEAGEPPRRWAAHVGEVVQADALDEPARIVRELAGGGIHVLYELDGVALSAASDPYRVDIELPEVDPDLSSELAGAFAAAGVPADPASIQLGDPNGNDTFGATLGGALIKPGDPARSYLMRRLIDPSAGPLMPLANCCSWTKASLRALWCWIAGLTPDGTNALAPIDYASCPPGPVEWVVYPEPGEGCDAAGLCPVQAKQSAKDEPTWANVYGNILRQRCAGTSCHIGGSAGGLDLSTAERAYGGLVTAGRVVPLEPDASKLYQRLAQECPPGEPCARMPLGLDPLPDPELAAVRGWIEAGARQD